MTNDIWTLDSARIVTRDAVLTGSLIVEGDTIVALDERPVVGQSLLVVPGVVDVHSDAIERVIEPRPRVGFPLELALPEADKLFAVAGVTTPYHAVCFGLEGRAGGHATEAVRALRPLRDDGLVDHRVHCRFEVSEGDQLDSIIELLRAGHADMVSVMDHSPGQGQFKSLESFVAYYTANYKISEAEATRRAEDKLAKLDGSEDRTRALAAAAKAAGVAFASHDDDDPSRCEFLAEIGATFCEFPINLETASAARERGMHTVLGAPNVIRGGSQSGSIRAIDAIREGMCDCLCSDFAPWTMLQAAFRLPELADLSLPEAINLVSLHPAEAAGLDDRGEIAVGKRADLVLVDDSIDPPRVREVLCAGRVAYSTRRR